VECENTDRESVCVTHDERHAFLHDVAECGLALVDGVAEEQLQRHGDKQHAHTGQHPDTDFGCDQGDDTCRYVRVSERYKKREREVGQ
jgi:hypothetical protein